MPCAERYNRLKAYEDTGLSPEEILALIRAADDDLISRDYVMNAILSLHGVGGMYLYDPTEVHAIIANAPSAYGERRTDEEL